VGSHVCAQPAALRLCPHPPLLRLFLTPFPVPSVLTSPQLVHGNTPPKAVSQMVAQLLLAKSNPQVPSFCSLAQTPSGFWSGEGFPQHALRAHLTSHAPSPIGTPTPRRGEGVSPPGGEEGAYAPPPHVVAPPLLLPIAWKWPSPIAKAILCIQTPAAWRCLVIGATAEMISPIVSPPPPAPLPFFCFLPPVFSLQICTCSYSRVIFSVRQNSPSPNPFLGDSSLTTQISTAVSSSISRSTKFDIFAHHPLFSLSSSPPFSLTHPFVGSFIRPLLF